MKKAIVKKGYVMKVKEAYNKKGYEEIYTLTDSISDFLDQLHEQGYYYTTIDDIKLIRNVYLYNIATCKPEGDIRILIDFRKNRKYKRYATIEDINNFLKNGYVVAVQGLGEIESINDLI